MNNHTADKLVAFADAVEQLTQAVLLHIGIQTASEVVQKCEDLKSAVRTDETITEVR